MFVFLLVWVAALPTRGSSPPVFLWMASGSTRVARVLLLIYKQTLCHITCKTLLSALRRHIDVSTSGFLSSCRRYQSCACSCARPASSLRRLVASATHDTRCPTTRAEMRRSGPGSGGAASPVCLSRPDDTKKWPTQRHDAKRSQRHGQNNSFYLSLCGCRESDEWMLLINGVSLVSNIQSTS